MARSANFDRGVPMQLKKVVIVDGVRSAFARGARGKLVATRLDDAGAQVLRALMDRNPKVPDVLVEEDERLAARHDPNERVVHARIDDRP